MTNEIKQPTAAADGAAQPAGDGWRGRLASLDGTFGFLKNLSLFSLIAVIAAAFFQFNQWSIEKSLERAKTDHELALKAFETSMDQLSRAQNLQEILFFTYQGAAGAPQERSAYFMARGKEAFDDYSKARRDLRIEIDELVNKSQLYIDWASDLNADKSLKSQRYAFDPISSNRLDANNFNCAAPASVPDYSSFQTLTTESFGDLQVDWRSAKHQLVIFYHCFNKLHGMLFAARLWASGQLPANPSSLPSETEAGKLSDKVQPILDNQVQRLNGLSMLMMTRVEQIRRLNELPSFFDFYFRSRDRILPEEAEAGAKP